MIARIIEIADDKRHLSKYRGFMIVHNTEGDRQELGRVPLEDISAVIANAHGLSYTNNLLVALAEQGAPFVLCSSSHNAVGMLLPVEGNFEQAHRMDAQLIAKLPQKKKIWGDLVRSKLEQQAYVLEEIGKPTAPLLRLAANVKSGDPQNLEAQGARIYWKFLFGEQFKRDRGVEGVNSLLNYGYTILRACTARAVIASGLHPSLGLHHSNDNNAMRLVDDLMEPFRPIIDLVVWKLNNAGIENVTPQSKRELALSLYHDLNTHSGSVPVTVAIQNLATSLAMVFLKERENINLPIPSIPMIKQSSSEQE